MDLHTTKPDNKENLAPVMVCCKHTPKTDEEKWYSPQDNWCDHCQCACCKECFETDHKDCPDRSGNSMTKKINAERKKEAMAKKSKPKTS